MPPRLIAVARAILVLCVSTAALRAQGGKARAWNDPRTIELVDRAVARRTAQLADSGLADYHAVAHGFLTFLAQIGEGYPDPPQVVRADELAVEVYWRAPNQSKQRLVGRRDTLLLPTDIAYHRDHLAIVQNNFPAIIRIGEGDEVRDVPHPLSARGRDAYEFAATDSLSIRVGSRSWDVIQVDVRPRDDRQPGAVGALYIDRETAAVVRMSIGFTRAAFLDPALEDISVVLDNGLVEGRFWLPRRQEIEIRRTGSWLDFPTRGIIRGQWDLCCVEANRGVPEALFPGPEIVFASPAELAKYPFAGAITDSLPARLQSALDGGSAQRVQEQAAALVSAAALARASGAVVSARRVSDFVRVNRVEGLSLGGAATVRLGPSWSVRAEGHYGIDDHRLKHGVSVARELPFSMRIAGTAFDALRPAGDVPESSVLANSIAAQEIGVDLTDDYRAAGVSLALSGGKRVRWGATIERVRESPVAVHATPFSGAYRPAFSADGTELTSATFDLGIANAAGPAGTKWNFGSAWTVASVDAMARASPGGMFSRGRVTASAERNVGAGTLLLSVVAASVVSGTAPGQHRVLFGGPETGPGYDAHALRGTTGASTRLEWQVQLFSFPLSLGRFGTTRVPVMAAPFAQGAWLTDRDAPFVPDRWARSVGLGMLSLHGLLRLDVVRGVDPGGRWVFRMDFGKAFWPIL
jgi:hypothetical protein